MLDQPAKPVSDNADLVEKAKAVLAEQKRTLQRTLATLAETQAAIERLQEQRRSPSRYFGAG